MADTSLAGNAEVEVTLRWISEDACHIERLFIEKFNFWRDIVPVKLVREMDGWKEGQVIRHAFDPGELLPKRSDALVMTIPRNKVAPKFEGRTVLLFPGVFLPRGIAAKGLMIFPQDVRPMQVLGVSEEHVTVDLNHPLAGRSLELSMCLHRMADTEGAHGGLCKEIVEAVTDGGPGMQARFEAPASCLDGTPLTRAGEGDDVSFYKSPRPVAHLDAEAERQVSALYGRLLQKGGRVLDLMASWNSHLDEVPASVRAVGLGMNEEELKANPRLSEMTVHDLNAAPVLPYGNESYDAVVCTASVEYAIHPVALFREVARVLKPGGPFVVTFTDRWFPSQVTRPWPEIHPFERMGLVLEYFRASEGFSRYHTESRRGWPRPREDRYFPQKREADPLLAVWGKKNGPPIPGQG